MKTVSSAAQDVHRASIAKRVGKGAESAPRTEGGNVVFFSSDQKILEALKELTSSNPKAGELRQGIEEIIARYDVPELPKEYEKFSFMNPETMAPENIIQFLERVWYDPWIKKGVLTRPDFRRLDERGEMAYRNWIRRKEFPDFLRLPSKSEEVTRIVAGQGDINLMRKVFNAYHTHTYQRR